MCFLPCRKLLQRRAPVRSLIYKWGNQDPYLSSTWPYNLSRKQPRWDGSQASRGRGHHRHGSRLQARVAPPSAPLPTAHMTGDEPAPPSASGSSPVQWGRGGGLPGSRHGHRHKRSLHDCPELFSLQYITSWTRRFMFTIGQSQEIDKPGFEFSPWYLLSCHLGHVTWASWAYSPPPKQK